MERSEYASQVVMLKENSSAVTMYKEELKELEGLYEFENAFEVEDYQDNLPGGATVISTGKLSGHWVQSGISALISADEIDSVIENYYANVHKLLCSRWAYLLKGV